MNIVLLQTRLSEEEIQVLIDDFPQYLFLSPSDATYKNLGKKEWGSIEVLYGSHFSQNELSMAHSLRWIHCPIPNLSALCLKDIQKQGNIIVTCTPEENIRQIGEYVMGGILAFAKNLFHWLEARKHPVILWDSKWRESMWTLNKRVFLQIGLGRVGVELARQAKQMEMQVWGVQEQRTFHAYCHKVFSFKELHSVLPAADVVSVALPRAKQQEPFLKKDILELMKDDSILVIIGAKALIDEEALIEAAATEKYRGILWDAFYQMPVPPQSKLWNIPNLLITPEVAPRPKSTDKESYRNFRYNLRQYLHGNFTDMRHVIETKSRDAGAG
ncbi:MAG: NAD(P)-dependent oxidoreductase [Waddliaceae bacterium]